MLFQLVQIVYWLALATWFGGALFIAVAYRVVFKTVDASKPILPDVLSVNLEGQHGTLLAGTIVGNILATFIRIELGCAGAMLAALIAQAFLIDPHDPEIYTSTVLPGVMLLAATAVAVFDWRVVWPRTWRFRQEFLDHADEPERANPAKDQFDRYQRLSVTLLEFLLFLLLGMVLFSSAGRPSPKGITPTPQNLAVPSESTHAG
jgi:hypothetical protein